ncbi:hypothetical protein IQ266_10905 [filamentous cyanobacterium LEGE 11480]|uniref:Uncharacterized protein n=1 Tax=Romeriopsis navalis LEGE 11480 TaxID=2777977 RepID=A0A928VQG0_9CYAN|nr:hypothetical protein [Romeriopsis navalis]MBE9030239.1 hypothetical protein [Romeriopsis navalis LEGE 11480]
MNQIFRFRQFLIVGFFAILLIWANQELLEDWLNVTPRPPSPSIARLATATTMTRSAQRLFYRQSPSIESQATFLSRCKVPDKAIMLGCYVRRGNVGKIVIQNVTDQRLKGTMEVTAAHELLHAAYEKLRQSERRDLGRRLSKAAARVKDPRLAKVLKDYRTKDRALYYNELHSHLGTELVDLGDAKLEKYYQRYFTDRQGIVRFAKKSGAVLKKLDREAEVLKPEIEQLEATLTQLEQQIKQAEATLKDSHQQLNRLESNLRRTKDSAEDALRTRSPQALQLATEFEQRKSEFNRYVNQHNERAQIQKDRVADFNTKVREYKQKINKYNSVARESRNILDSLTAR